MTNSTPDDTFRALHDAVKPHGARLFTITVLDPAAGLVRRAYTSHPDAYPTSGTKPMRADAWSVQVIDNAQSFVANTTPEFAIYFSDHALINDLGCHSALNMPVRDGDRVVGTVNILDAEGHFTPDRVATFEALVEQHRPALLKAIAATPLEA